MTIPPRSLFTIAEAPARVLYHTLVPLDRRWSDPNKVPIVFYHDVSETLFESHVSYLTSHYEVISLERAVAGLRGETNLPSNPVVITFDDGYRTIHSQVRPVVESYGIPVTVYLTTGAIDDGTFWWEKVASLQAKGADIPPVEELRTRAPERRKEYIETTSAESAVEFDRLALNWKEVRELDGSAFFDFQAHTRSHPYLPALSIEDALSDIQHGVDDIESELDTDVSHFSYPFGGYDPELGSAIAEDGFESAVAVVAGTNTPETDLFQLRRLGVESSSQYLLASQLEGTIYKLTLGLRSFEYG